MDDTPNPSTLTRRTNRILIALFSTLLALPTLDTFFRIDWSKPISENRRLATFPEFEPGGLGLQAYVAGMDAYFTDHFGFRKCLVMWHNKMKWRVFKDAQGGREVLVAKDGWLFYTAHEMINHYTGLLQFTPEQMHDWQVLLEKRRDWLARRGIAYVFVVTPDKESVYPEYLPDWMSGSKIRAESKLDQFVAYMRDHSTVPVLDQRGVVRDGKQICPTFFVTDVHWNLFGGFLGYQELMQAMDKLRPDLEKPLPLSSFTLTNKLQPGGDLARMLGQSLVESNAYILLPKPGLPVFTSKFPPDEHPKDPKFTYNPQAKGHLTVFQDSFAMNWVQFLGYHFHQVDYVWQSALDAAWIEREKPDVVVSEMNELMFNIANPNELMAKEALR